jgi:hypothetical protein
MILLVYALEEDLRVIKLGFGISKSSSVIAA